MIRYITRRSLQIVLTLFIFHALLFFLVALQPGDGVPGELPPGVTPKQLKMQREYFGLDKPIHVRYLISLRNVVTGNLGFSYDRNATPVTEILRERLPRTLTLFLTSTAISFYFGFSLGKMIVRKRGSLTEHALTLGGMTLFTMFTPVFGLFLLWLFGLKLGWLPIGKFIDARVWLDAEVSTNHVFSLMLLNAAIVGVLVIGTAIVVEKMAPRFSPFVVAASLLVGVIASLIAWSSSGLGAYSWDIVQHMVLPVISVTLVSFASTMLLTRNSMLDALREDYVTAARAKGLSEKEVIDRHVSRNALLPIATSLVFSMAFAIDGSVIIESIFSWPGMGDTLVESVRGKDIPLAIGAFGFIGILVLVAHLIADVTYAFLDPRIRYS